MSRGFPTPTDLEYFLPNEASIAEASPWSMELKSLVFILLSSAYFALRARISRFFNVACFKFCFDLGSRSISTNAICSEDFQEP
jgi:hypothetical protein